MAAAVEIRLTKGLTALVSPEDACLSESKWQAFCAPGKRPYALGKVKVGPGKTNRKTVSLHRVVVGVIPKGFMVDHINGDTLDCRRENLRVVDATINNRNREGAQRNSSTGHLGVYPNGKKFSAMIKNGGVIKFIGNFSTIAEAAEARKKAEIEIWGVEPRRAKALGVI